MSFYNSVCYFLHAPKPLMKRFKWQAVFLATNLETLGMVPFFGFWSLQDKMLSVGPGIKTKKLLVWNKIFPCTQEVN